MTAPTRPPNRPDTPRPAAKPRPAISRKHIGNRPPGDHNAWREGCRCYPCSDAWAAYRKRQLRSDWKPFVDAQPVREHIAYLSANGIGNNRVAHLAGIERSTVRSIRGVGGRKPNQRVRTEIAERILAIRPTLETVDDGTFIDGTGTYRRLRALSGLGLPAAYLSQRLGEHHRHMHLLHPTPYVRARYARAVRRLYDELSLLTEAEVDRLGLRPAAVTTARKRALALGWPLPLDWDDDEIDNPNAQPRLARRTDAKAAKGCAVTDDELDDLEWILGTINTDKIDPGTRDGRELIGQRLGVTEHRVEYMLGKLKARQRIGIAA